MATKITDEMVTRAFAASKIAASPYSMRLALESVAAELGAQEPGPFVRTGDEEHAMKHLISREPHWADIVHNALERALRTLGAQPAQGDEWTEDDAATLYQAWEDKDSDSCDPLLAALNQAFPRGKPVAQELTQLERSRRDNAEKLCAGNSLGEEALRDCIAIIDRLANIRLLPTPVEAVYPVDPFLALEEFRVEHGFVNLSMEQAVELNHLIDALGKTP